MIVEKIAVVALGVSASLAFWFKYQANRHQAKKEQAEKQLAEAKREKAVAEAQLKMQKVKQHHEESIIHSDRNTVIDRLQERNDFRD